MASVLAATTVWMPPVAGAQGRALVDAASLYALELGCLPALEAEGTTAQVRLGDGSYIRADEGWSHFRPSADGSSTVIVVQGNMDIGGPEPLIACVAIEAPSRLEGGGELSTQFVSENGGGRPQEGASAVFRLEFEGEATVMAAASGSLTIDYADDEIIRGTVTFTGPAWDPQAQVLVAESEFPAHATFEARRCPPLTGSPTGCGRHAPPTCSSWDRRAIGTPDA